MALTIVFDHETKEKALKLRDELCNALVGIPGFVNNEIIVNTQDIDKETLQPLNGEVRRIFPNNNSLGFGCRRLESNDDTNIFLFLL